MLDDIDRKIVELLRQDGRMSNMRLASQVGLSPSACLRRLRALERDVIRGYTAIVKETPKSGRIVVIVQVSLENQTQEGLRRFEQAVRKCAMVRDCYLMAGMTDYLLRVEVDSLSDYERIHSEVLSRLPGVDRIQSNVALRNVI